MAKNWSPKRTETLINTCVDEWLPIWNFGSEKEDPTGETWKKVVDRMKKESMDESQVRAKVKSLGDEYNNELAKLEKDPSYKTSTKWFHLIDSFRRPRLSTAENSQNLSGSPVPAPQPRQVAETPSTSRQNPSEPPAPSRAQRFYFTGEYIVQQLNSFPSDVARATEIEIMDIIIEKMKQVGNQNIPNRD